MKVRPFRLSLLVFFLVLTANFAFGQTTRSTFTNQHYAAQPSTRQVLTADVNNDGVPDLILWSEGQNSFSVMLANGDGSFQSPVAHSFAPIADHYWASMASADFNRDGNADIV